MGRLAGHAERPWRVITVAVGGLLVAILVVGVVGLLLHRNVENTTNSALNYDTELEDDGDDIELAVLELRARHQEIALSGPTDQAIADHEDAYEGLIEEIGELEDLGVRDQQVPQPEQLRRNAETYNEDFLSSVDLHDSDPEAFEQASDRGLQRLEGLQTDAVTIYQLGEEFAEDALRQVDRANATAGVVLMAVLGGLILAGAIFAYAAVRMAGELRELQAKERAAAQEAARASQAKTEFLADVSHELRTPLTTLRSNIEIGMQAEGDSSYYQRLLAKMFKESGKISRMVEDLLLLARSDSGSLPLKLETLDVELLLAEIAGRAQMLAEERSLNLQTRITGKGRLEVDLEKIEQSVLILLDNAVRYGPEGGRITLASRTDTTSSELIIEVSDEGPGIPEEELPRIFERFYRIEKSRSRKLGGSGLGLPIARTIIEAHGGHIEAESHPGKGTRMLLHIPLCAQPDLSDVAVGGDTEENHNTA